MMKYFDATTSDKDILKKDVLRDFVYLKAETLFVGKNAVDVQPVDVLDVRFDIPYDTKIDPDQISEGARSDQKRLSFYQINTTLDKYQTNVLVTDESKARQIANNQVALSLDASANGLAYAKDTEIFTTLQAGANLTQAASAMWNNPTTADPASDIANAIGKIFDATTLTDADLPNMYIFYPAKLWGHLSKPVQIGEIQMTLRNWAEREYKVNLFPTRQLANDALAVIKSNQTAIHLQYSGADVPTSEFERITGVGDSYLITQYYKTLIVPYAKSQTTSKRICKITGVC